MIPENKFITTLDLQVFTEEYSFYEVDQQYSSFSVYEEEEE